MDAKVEEIGRIRAAVAAEVARSTLRAVARRVGMSPSGLRKFLEGTKPYAPTLDRLRSWYFHAAGVHRMTPADIAAVLRGLVLTLPEPATGVVNLLAAVETSYEQAGMYPPEWVNAVRARNAA